MMKSFDLIQLKNEGFIQETLSNCLSFRKIQFILKLKIIKINA